MKYLLIICFIPILAFAQDKVMRVYKNDADSLILVKYPQSKTVKVKEGITYKWRIPETDTARFFESETGEQLEATMTFKKVGGTIPDPEPVIVEQIVDAADGKVTFTGSWVKGPTNATGWHGNTIAFSNTPGATVTYTFTGRKIEFYAETLFTHGTGTVKIDNEPEVTVSFKSPTKVLPAKIFEKSWTSDGPHTITVKVVSGYVLADYFKVFKVQ